MTSTPCLGSGRLATLVLISTMGASRHSMAQRPGSTGAPDLAKTWHAIGDLRIEEQTNNNVYLLSDSARFELGALTTTAATGSRFADMESAADYITLVRGSLGIEGPGLFGRKLSLRSSAGYDLYAQNARRRSGEIGLSVAQQLPLHARLKVQARLAPGRFVRNFMSDAIDLNGDGSIQSSERIFAPGRYDDAQLSAAYRQPLKRSTPNHPFGLALDLEVGHSARTYAAPLGYRSYRGPILSATVRAGLTRSVKLSVGYTRAWLNGRSSPAVLRLDETDFGRDLNGNGTTTDSRVRTVQLVDFSRREQYFDARLDSEVAGSVALQVWYQHRWRWFPSSLPFDVLNNSRRDQRDFVGAELRWPLGSGADLRFGADFQVQTRAQPPGTALIPGVTDFTRRRLYAGLGYQL